MAKVAKVFLSKFPYSKRDCYQVVIVTGWGMDPRNVSRMKNRYLKVKIDGLPTPKDSLLKGPYGCFNPKIKVFTPQNHPFVHRGWNHYKQTIHFGGFPRIFGLTPI